MTISESRVVASSQEPARCQELSLTPFSQREPFDGIGKPEQLRGDMAGWWSRKIDDKHRVIYQADEKTVTILACRDHYDDH